MPILMNKLSKGGLGFVSKREKETWGERERESMNWCICVRVCVIDYFLNLDDVIEMGGKHWRHTHVDWILTK